MNLYKLMLVLSQFNYNADGSGELARVAGILPLSSARWAHHRSVTGARRSSAMDVNQHAHSVPLQVRNAPGCRPKTELH
jgi:hypothetical protein